MKSVFRITMLTLVLGGSAATAQTARAPDAAGNRTALEQQFRQRAAAVAKQRLGLTDAQMTQLEQSNARFGPRLNQIAAQERETRSQLRAEMTNAEPNQQHVSTLLDASLQLQKQRIALVEEQQKDLARFMTPVQRARYIALQQQLRRRAQELSRQNQMGGKGGGHGGPRKIR